MLNTVLFRDTLRKDILGDCNFLVSKLFYVNTHRRVLKSGLAFSYNPNAGLWLAFGWASHGGDRFWRTVYSKGSQVIPAYWEDYA